MMHRLPGTLRRQGLRALLPLLALARVGGAQDSAAAFKCDGMPVASISVETERPIFRGYVMERWRQFARSLGFHHQTTNRGLVRRFVSLDQGLGCTEFRRSESQRILRAQPYLADAVVSVNRLGDSVRVGVATIDEVPVVAGARLQGASLRALSIGTMNFMGAGMHVEGKWERARGLRQGFGGRVSHPQLLGRPYSIEIDGMRRPLGEHFVVGVQHPFYTDLQRIAWHAGYATSKDFMHLRRPDRSAILQPVDRGRWNLGGVMRFGPPLKLGLVGGMIIGERIVPRHEFLRIDSVTGQALPTTDTAGVRHYDTYDVTNIAGVLGARALRYSRMAGLDALVAEQDVATGTQIALMLGARPWAREPLRESFAAGDMFLSGRLGRHFAGARVEAETRIDLEDRDWAHFIVGGRAAWYYKPTDRWVSELSLDGAGGWRTIVPYQLELGDRRTGLRGYARSHEAGGQRLVARVEQRGDFGRVRVTRAAFGGAFFTEAGRIWRGDVPFGVETPVRWSAGVAIIAAVPAKSQRTMRAEVAFPFSRTTGARTELRFSIREPTRGFWREPDRLRWARLAAVPEQIFNWP
jgi:hypothetical protein